ncbi:TPA: AAA family ATPase [archaeon]|nr:AAA family ATPase [Candidatus Naiadarchaeales archaeon SRR2090153.bin461]
MIKSLELQSFKSFDSRISIPLSKGITAIVGPNGSGKSNIVDAFCFILGRTSAKSMRADRLTHLIHNGGKRKQPSPFLEVSVTLDNKERKLGIDADELTVTRRLTRNGTMTYKINEEKCTRSKLVDILSLSSLNPEGFNIILQGNITGFIDMDPEQRRQIIDEVSGISEYESKKEDAKKDLTKVEENIKEIVIMLSERKKRIQELADEKGGAEKYKTLKDELAKLEANLCYSKVKRQETECARINSELDGKNTVQQEVKKELDLIDREILKKEKELRDLNNKLIQEGGSEQLAIRSETDNLKSRIQIAESKINSKKAEISNIDSMMTRLQGILEEREDGDSKVSLLKENIKGVHGTVNSLYKVDEKYSSAIDAAIGNRGKFIVVEDEDIALECIQYLKNGQLGRATFLPINLIRGQKAEGSKEKGVLGLAINYIKFNDKHRKIFEYVVGETLLVETLEKVKPLLGKHRLVSLDGDLADKSGAITGGFRKRPAQKQGNEIDEMSEKRDSLLDEIEAIQMEMAELNKRLAESHKKESTFGMQFQELQTARNIIETEIEQFRGQKGEVSSKHDEVVRKVGDLRIVKAQEDQRLDDLNLNMKKYVQAEFNEIDIASSESQVDKFMKEITALEPVNMRAIEEYDLEVQGFKEFEGKFNTLQEERKAVLNFIDEIESKKKEVFFGVYNKVSEEFVNIFPKLSPNGEAKLILENEENPFEGGMLVESRPAGKKFQSLDLLSGGEKVLTALAFLFSLQRYRPAPIYILDEVDAALDQHNSMRFVDLLRENIGDGQMLLISHNPAVVKKVDRLFGVSMTGEGVTKLIGIDMAEYQGAVPQEAN